jgi:hypothetical protein
MRLAWPRSRFSRRLALGGALLLVYSAGCGENSSSGSPAASAGAGGSAGAAAGAQGGDTSGDAGAEAAGGDGAGTTWTSADYCQPRAEILCAIFERCELQQATDGCVEAQTESCVADSAYRLASIEEDRLQWDIVTYQACFEDHRDDECDGLIDFLSECTLGTLTGKVATGDACTFDYDCADGYCLFEQCPGTCTEYAGLDESCLDGERCDPELSCRFLSADAAECRKLEPAGADCRDEHDCASQICREAQCAAEAELGDACSFDDSCPAPERCVWNEQAMRSECTDVPGDGEPCTQACERGFFCDLGQQQCMPLGGVDDPCTSLLECEPGLWCDEMSCAERVGAGDACSPDMASCEDGLTCGGEAGAETCRAPGSVAEGDSCSSTYECAAGTYCAAGSCAPGQDEGSSCIDQRDCLEALFCDFGADNVAPGECTAKHAAGEACVSDYECEQGFCIGNECSPECRP